MLARPHPVFGDWCYCQPGDSQRLLDRQLSYRDAALRDNPEFSGMPPEFEQWCRTSWLPANLGRDYYRKQAETHIQSLATKISRLSGDLTELLKSQGRQAGVCGCSAAIKLLLGHSFQVSSSSRGISRVTDPLPK